MANQGKHKSNPAREWLDGDDSTVPTHSRSSHLIGAYIKKKKPSLKKIKPPTAAAAQVFGATLTELHREPASPAAAKLPPVPPHWKRNDPLSQLRAPYHIGNR
jgi:hypothetical protein